MLCSLLLLLLLLVCLWWFGDSADEANPLMLELLGLVGGHKNITAGLDGLNEDLRLLLDTSRGKEEFPLQMISGTTPEWHSRYRCSQIRRPVSPGAKSTCCVREGTDMTKVKCLPSFIIGGTQKSGTTVLSAYLASHPLISFPPKKEVHYFSDGKKRKNLRIEDYFGNFVPWEYAKPEQRAEPLINGEATPYYLASRLACRKMANNLPHVKFIVLMREPVSRSYSEYQMKRRRVETQDTFIALAFEYANRLRSCLLDAGRKTSVGPDRWDFIKTCVPLAVSESPHWPKFRNAFMTKMHGNTTTPGSWERAVDSCFPLVASTEAEALQIQAMAGRKVAEADHALRSSRPNLRVSRRLLNERDGEEDGEGEGEEAIQPYDASDWGYYSNDSYFRLLSSAPRSLSIPSSPHLLHEPGAWRRAAWQDDRFGNSSRSLAQSSPPSLLPLEGRLELGQGQRRRRLFPSTGVTAAYAPTRAAASRFFASSTSSAAETTATFKPVQCLEKHARERLSSPRAAFQEELSRFKQCAGSLLSDHTLESLDKAVEKCLTIRVGIADNYIYRSLYAVQLYNCFKYIPRSNFLLLPAERLQQEPRRALKEVLEFLGLPLNEEVLRLASMQNDNKEEASDAARGASHRAALNASFLSDAVKKHFPKFELSTGWAPVGEYEPMSALLRRELLAFFAPHNKLLFDFLGVDWSQEWQMAPARTFKLSAS